MQFIDEFEIEDLGVQEEYVYDIEVGDNHNFFGNDILVHNSGYFSLDKVKHLIFNENDPIQDKIDKIDKYVQKHLDPIIKNINGEYAEVHNAFDPSQINADREAIADAGVFVAKKRYFLRVYDMEGVRYDQPYIKKMGIELIKSSTPKFVKEELAKSIDIILDGDNKDLVDWLGKTKTKFITVPIIDISKTTGVSKVNYNPNDVIPINSRAAMTYNKYITENKLENQHNLINPGDKMKLVYLKEPNIFKSNVIGFNDNRFMEKFRDYVDFDMNWEKNFISPLDIMTKSLKYKLENTTNDGLDDW